MRGKVKLSYAAFRRIRQSPEVMHMISEEARAMCDRANSMHVTKGAEYDYAVAQTTEHGSVALCTTGGYGTPHYRAKIDNAKHNTLLKAVTG